MRVVRWLVGGIAFAFVAAGLLLLALVTIAVGGTVLVVRAILEYRARPQLSPRVEVIHEYPEPPAPPEKVEPLAALPRGGDPDE